MDEFALIDRIIGILGDTTAAPFVRVGPGDDAAITASPAGFELVSSIDTLVSGVHFPADAPGQAVGYRALMVALSDVAAMGAENPWALVALTLPSSPEEQRTRWACDVAAGMRDAARRVGAKVIGGNLARGPLSLTISAHGHVPVGQALLRSGARPGDRVFVSGRLGGAAAAVRKRTIFAQFDGSEVSAYYQPLARFDLGCRLRKSATAAIDISDGLLQDLGHICAASHCGANILSKAVPVHELATLEDALTGGDDYQLCFTGPSDIAALAGAADDLVAIGDVVLAPGVTLDGVSTGKGGYRHF